VLIKPPVVRPLGRACHWNRYESMLKGHFHALL